MTHRTRAQWLSFFRSKIDTTNPKLQDAVDQFKKETAWIQQELGADVAATLLFSVVVHLLQDSFGPESAAAFFNALPDSLHEFSETGDG